MHWGYSILPLTSWDRDSRKYTSIWFPQIRYTDLYGIVLAYPLGSYAHSSLIVQWLLDKNNDPDDQLLEIQDEGVDLALASQLRPLIQWDKSFFYLCLECQPYSQ